MSEGWIRTLIEYLGSHPEHIALVITIGGYVWEKVRADKLADMLLATVERLSNNHAALVERVIASQTASTEVMRGIREAVERSRGWRE